MSPQSIECLGAAAVFLHSLRKDNRKTEVSLFINIIKNFLIKRTCTQRYRPSIITDKATCRHIYLLFTYVGYTRFNKSMTSVINF